MMTGRKKAFAGTLLTAILLWFAAAADPAGADNWYKGNIHCHSNKSDGVISPMLVAEWYRRNSYNFLFITDHDVLTDPEEIKSAETPRFILIGGEEVSANFDKKQIHLNALGITETIKPVTAPAMVEQIQKNIDQINEKGGICQFNHFLRGRHIDEDILSRLQGVTLLEVYNMNYDNHNFSAGGLKGTEEIWDGLLSRGMKLWGTASDDAHAYHVDFLAEWPCPGRGWITVKAPELTRENILSAIRKGDFYAGNGIVYSDIRITKKSYSLTIEQKKLRAYTTFFIGKNGEVLKTEHGLNPSYDYRGDELYVRAKTICSSGEFAITQPYFLK